MDGVASPVVTGLHTSPRMPRVKCLRAGSQSRVGGLAMTAARQGAGSEVARPVHTVGESSLRYRYSMSARGDVPRRAASCCCVTSTRAACHADQCPDMPWTETHNVLISVVGRRSHRFAPKSNRPIDGDTPFGAAGVGGSVRLFSRTRVSSSFATSSSGMGTDAASDEHLVLPVASTCHSLSTWCRRDWSPGVESVPHRLVVRLFREHRRQPFPPAVCVQCRDRALRRVDRSLADRVPVEHQHGRSPRQSVNRAATLAWKT